MYGIVLNNDVRGEFPESELVSRMSQMGVQSIGLIDGNGIAPVVDDTEYSEMSFIHQGRAGFSYALPSPLEITKTYTLICDLEKSRAAYILYLQQQFTANVLALVKRTELLELITWSSQETEANAVIAGSATPLQIATATNRLKNGESLEDWAAEVAQKKAPATHAVESLAVGVMRRAIQAAEEVELTQDNWQSEFERLIDDAAADLGEAKENLGY